MLGIFPDGLDQQTLSLHIPVDLNPAHINFNQSTLHFGDKITTVCCDLSKERDQRGKYQCTVADCPRKNGNSHPFAQIGTNAEKRCPWLFMKWVRYCDLRKAYEAKNVVLASIKKPQISHSILVIPKSGIEKVDTYLSNKLMNIEFPKTSKNERYFSISGSQKGTVNKALHDKSTANNL